MTTTISIRSNGPLVFVKGSEKDRHSYDGRTKLYKFHAANEARYTGIWQEILLTNDEAKQFNLI